MCCRLVHLILVYNFTGMHYLPFTYYILCSYLKERQCKGGVEDLFTSTIRIPFSIHKTAVSICSLLYEYLVLPPVYSIIFFFPVLSGRIGVVK